MWLEEAEKELDKIKIIRINKFLNRSTMRKTIFNTLNQNTKKDLTNRILKIIKYQKLVIVRTLWIMEIIDGKINMILILF